MTALIEPGETVRCAACGDKKLGIGVHPSGDPAFVRFDLLGSEDVTSQGVRLLGPALYARVAVCARCRHVQFHLESE